MRRLCREAFRQINERHGFPPIVPAAEVAVRRVGSFHRHSSVVGVVGAGRILGFSFRSGRDPVRAVGPIVTDPAAQGYGVGRRLVQALPDRARGVRHPYPVRALLIQQRLGCWSAVVWLPCIGRGAGLEKEVANHSQLG